MDNLVRVPHHGGYVGGHKMTMFAYPDDQRTSPPGHHNLPDGMPVDHPDAEGPFHLRHGLPHRISQIALKINRDQLGKNFRIRFGPENNPFFLKILLDAVVVFNNPVVHHEYVFILIPLGMRIFFRRFPMGCPSGMGDSGRAFHFPAGDLGFQFGDFSDGPGPQNGFPVLNSQARGIIAPVLQPFQSFHQDRFGIPLTDIADNTAHI